MNPKRLLMTAAAALMIGSFAAPAPAQPNHPKAKAKAKQAKEKAKERRDNAKERREERREERQDKKEKLADKKARHQELKDKADKGELTEDEKAELEQMEERHAKLKERHRELKKKWEERKKTRKDRRKKARAKVVEKYPNIKKHPAAIAEMRKHARRMAMLHRSRNLAEAEGRDDLVEKIDALVDKEKSRHQAIIRKHEDKIK